MTGRIGIDCSAIAIEASCVGNVARGDNGDGGEVIECLFIGYRTTSK